MIVKGVNKATSTPDIDSSGEKLPPAIHGVKSEQSKVRKAEWAHFKNWPR
jgi:hypothetical protein